MVWDPLWTIAVSDGRCLRDSLPSPLNPETVVLHLVIRVVVGPLVEEFMTRSITTALLAVRVCTGISIFAGPGWTRYTPESRSAHENRFHRTIVQVLRPSLSPR